MHSTSATNRSSDCSSESTYECPWQRGMQSRPIYMQRGMHLRVSLLQRRPIYMQRRITLHWCGESWPPRPPCDACSSRGILSTRAMRIPYAPVSRPGIRTVIEFWIPCVLSDTRSHWSVPPFRGLHSPCHQRRPLIPNSGGPELTQLDGHHEILPPHEGAILQWSKHPPRCCDRRHSTA